MVEVSVILPSRDEEETISICINKIQKAFHDYDIHGEIIVADNSRDETPIIAKDLGAKVINPDKSGYGYAYKYAFNEARGKYIVLGDADDTYDFMEMANLLEPLKRGEADLVIGSRLNGRIEKGAMPRLHKWIGNPLLTWVLNSFYKAGVSDAHSGFRAITKNALKKLDLRADGMEFASEMIIEAVEKGLTITETPISYSKRKNGDSKLSSFRDGWSHLKLMLLQTPNHLFIYPGLSLLIAGLFLMIASFLNLNLGYMAGIHSIFAGGLLTATGYQALFFGFFANIRKGRGLPKFITLEKGATIGALLFLTGFIYVTVLISEWVNSGFTHLPQIEQDVIGFTFIVLGIQTFFSSFMLSIIAES